MSADRQVDWFTRRLGSVDRLGRELEGARLQIREMAEAFERVRVAIGMPAGVAQCVGDIATEVEKRTRPTHG